MSTLTIVRFLVFIHFTTEPSIWTIANVEMLLEAGIFINIFYNIGLGYTLRDVERGKMPAIIFDQEALASASIIFKR